MPYNILRSSISRSKIKATFVGNLYGKKEAGANTYGIKKI
jgi:hypothetical protein